MQYFDHNASAPLSAVAREAWLEAADTFPGNPSSQHRVGARADKALENARQDLADILACSALDILWTSGATESNNTVWHHLARTLSAEDEVWVSAIEHPCCMESARHYMGDRIRWMPVDSDGLVHVDWLESSIARRRPALVCVMAANNETGCLQPWREIQTWCAQHQIPFFCDAAQWVGRLPSAGLGSCDWVSACAHKFGGPKGVGFLKCPRQGRMNALLLGGPQELNRRAGTENVAGILSMVAALKDREASMHPETLREKNQLKEAFESLLGEQLPGFRVLGRESDRLWNTSMAILPEVDCRVRWVVKLDKLGFAVSTGSACASGKEKGSHVLEAMGLDPSTSSRVLRFSSGWDASLDAWLALAEAVQRVHASIRSQG